MANEQQKGTGSPVVLRDRYLIYPASPLPMLNVGSAQAFFAQDRREPTKSFFALIARPGYPTRINTMRVLKGVESPGLMNLVEWGVTDWPPAARKVMAVVYERPMGGRVVDDLKVDFRGVDEVDLVRKVVTPIAQTLRDFRGQGVLHRAIRPTNLFWATAEKDRMVLGDCVTAPAALDQPAVVETIESGMAHPAARGPGTQADDYYAFGASILLLLLGRNPLRSMEDETVVRAKLAQNSYGILVGDERLPLPVIELLRGLLCDDSELRWDHEALELWLSGRRLTPIMARAEKRAARGFTVEGKDYYFSRDLAMALAANWEAGKQIVSDGRLELWVRRSLDQKEKAAALAALISDQGPDRGQNADIVLAKACMILDPHAPIRYKGLSMMPGGIGTFLALAVIQGGDIRKIAEALMRDAVKAWVETRTAYNPDNSIIDNSFRSVKSYLDRGTIGNGVERILYDLNDAMPCLSPFTVEDYVVEIRDLLPALNAAAKKSEGKGWPVDRHVAGFVAARANFDIERQIMELTDPKPSRALLAMANLLATLQWRLGQGGLYGLSTWVAGVMQPVVESYHGREHRRALEKELPRLAREGNLVEMVRLLENPEERARDTQGYEQARRDWVEASEEIQRIAEGEHDPHETALRTARQVASLISVGIALATVTILLLQRLL